MAAETGCHMNRILTVCTIVSVLAAGMCLVIPLTVSAPAADAFSAGGIMFPIIIIAVVTVLWILKRSSLFAVNISFFVFSLLIVFGLLRGNHTLLYGTALLLAMTGWSLSLLYGQFSRTAERHNEKRIVKDYARRLGTVIGIGAVLVALGVVIRLNLNFWIILLVVLLGIWLTGRLIRSRG